MLPLGLGVVKNANFGDFGKFYYPKTNANSKTIIHNSNTKTKINEV